MVECVKANLIEGRTSIPEVGMVLPLLGGSRDYLSLIPQEYQNDQFRSVYYWDNYSPNERLFRFLPYNEQVGDVCLIQPASTDKGSLLSVKESGLVLRQNGHALVVQGTEETQVGFNAVWRFAPRQGRLVSVPPDVILCSSDCCLGILPGVYGVEMGVVVVETNKIESREVISLLRNYIPQKVLSKVPQIKSEEDPYDEAAQT